MQCTEFTEVTKNNVHLSTALKPVFFNRLEHLCSFRRHHAHLPRNLVIYKLIFSCLFSPMFPMNLNILTVSKKTYCKGIITDTPLKEILAASKTKS